MSTTQHQAPCQCRKRFTDKVVIVTGASGGIGAEVAVAFGKEGASVVIHGRNAERLENTAQALSAAGVAESRICKVIGLIEEDTTAERIVKETMEKFGRIDVLVNNVGASSMISKFERNSVALCDQMYRVNFRSIVLLTELAMPHLIATKGNVVNVSSMSAHFVMAPMDAFYAVTKAALEHYTRLWASLYGAQGVRVNAIAPGCIDTLVVAEERGLCLQPDYLVEYAKRNSVLGRIGQVHELTPTLLLLASNDDASYVTGSVWVVDGGVLVKELPLPEVDLAYWNRQGGGGASGAAAAQAKKEE